MTDHVEADDAAELLGRAQAGDRDAFQQLVEPHRRALHLHCYRMLGSLDEADDLVQETFLRAWRGLDTFEARAAVRNWLYRIATNASLNALARRAHVRRVLPEALGPPHHAMPGPVPASDVPWLGPYPDAALEGVVDAAPGPDAQYEQREAVRLSFLAAVQLLPPRQRAALLLHDVLGWTSAETARALEGSVASINSLFQRARATLARALPPGGARPAAATSDGERATIERYVQAWESGDPTTFVAVLTEDAVLSMPPWPLWYRGREAVATLIAWTARCGGNGPFRLVPTAANGERAFAFYSRFGADGEWRPHSIQIVTLAGDFVSAMTSFVEPALVARFGLPPVYRGGSFSASRS